MCYLNTFDGVSYNSPVSGGGISNSPVGTEGLKEYTDKKSIPNNVVNIQYYHEKPYSEDNLQIKYEHNNNFTKNDRYLLENFLSQLVNKSND